MIKYHLIIAVSVGLTSSVCSATDVDLSKLPPPSDKKGLTYAKDVKPILEASCLRCHGGERPKGGLRLDSLEGALQGGKEGKVISPGDSKKSLLVVAAARLDPETAMPPMKGPGQFGRGGGGQRGPGGPPPGGAGGQPPQGAPGGQGGGIGRGPGGPGGPGGFGPPPKPLTPEQVGVLRAWIDQGAR